MACFDIFRDFRLLEETFKLAQAGPNFHFSLDDCEAAVRKVKYHAGHDER